MIVKLMCVGTFVLIILNMPGNAAETEKESAALKSAEKWLSLVDEERYKESWENAAEYFRKAVKRDQWEESLLAIRTPLGKTVSRKVKSTTYKTALPGAPDGEYVVIEFSTSFERKRTATETVTPMMDKDQEWRVSGYYIK